MKMVSCVAAGWLAVMAWLGFTPGAFGFEGRLHAVVVRGGQTEALLYSAGTNCLRVENADTNWPNAVDLVDRNTGAVTLLYPNNRSFVRLKPGAYAAPATPGGFAAPPPAPAMPAGIGPGGVGPAGAAGMPAPAAPPQMPAMPSQPMNLKATGDTTNLLGLACERFELKQRGEVMEIWATSGLLPFVPYRQNQPQRHGPRRMDEQWAELLAAQKLFPLLVTVKFENGAERYRFQVTAVDPQRFTDDDAPLFEPPPDYHEIDPLPF